MKTGLWVLTFLVFATIGFPTSSLGPVIKISTHPDNVNGLDFFSQIAADPSGNSFVTFRGHDGYEWEIYFAFISQDAEGPVVSHVMIASRSGMVQVNAVVDDTLRDYLPYREQSTSQMSRDYQERVHRCHQ